jgi:hypothetical protein
MTRKEFERYINRTVEIVNEYTDKQGSTPSVEVGRLFNRKVVNVIFWHGATPEVRKSFLDGRIKRFDQCGYPVIFDNHQGGGEVQSFTIMWTSSMSPSKVTAEELFNQVMEEDTPVDKSWLNQLRRERNDNELLEWAKGNVQDFATSNTPKRTITRAAEMLVNRLWGI